MECSRLREASKTFFRPLQERKTAMLKDLADAGANRKNAPVRMHIEDGTTGELAAF